MTVDPRVYHNNVDAACFRDGPLTDTPAESVERIHDAIDRAVSAARGGGYGEDRVNRAVLDTRLRVELTRERSGLDENTVHVAMQVLGLNTETPSSAEPPAHLRTALTGESLGTEPPANLQAPSPEPPPVQREVAVPSLSDLQAAAPVEEVPQLPGRERAAELAEELRRTGENVARQSSAENPFVYSGSGCEALQEALRRFAETGEQSAIIETPSGDQTVREIFEDFVEARGPIQAEILGMFERPGGSELLAAIGEAREMIFFL